jgi:DNA (cytosine-5)-methyltransferase 1
MLSSIRKPVLLDLFCCAGGAAMGYHRAGFEVIGVDIEPQPRYPFRFEQGDAQDVLDALILKGTWRGLGRFDAVHASPPCQAYSPLNAYNRIEYPDLVDATREQLLTLGLPYVIENVPQAPLRDPERLCGAMFGLRLYRHRDFETNWPLMALPHPTHEARCVRNGYLPAEGQFMSIHGGKHSKAWQRAAALFMDVPWTRSIKEVCEAIPPAYTEWIGERLLEHINADRTELANAA